MPFRLSLILACLFGAAVWLTACRGASPPPAGVTIDSPAEGDTVRGSAVHVMLSARGIELAPASEERPGTAHHHLFLDVETGPLDQEIPAGVTGIIHLGRAQTEFHWDGVAAGAHRIIAVLGDWSHVPLVPPATDTVRFVVQPR
ncbi:MAG: DUF4399 domain-containing protein [Gemmatimonadales bacterium]